MMFTNIFYRNLAVNKLWINTHLKVQQMAKSTNINSGSFYIAFVEILGMAKLSAGLIIRIPTSEQKG